MATVHAIAQAIEEYAARHPEAADGTDGIRQWWLGERWRHEPLQRLDAALEHLVAAGRMEKLVLADGRVIYRTASVTR